MWNAAIPLWVRLLSLFHVALPVFLLLALRRLGYDRSALRWQSVLALGLLLASLPFGAELNLNYVFRDPVLHRTLVSEPIHFAITLAVIIVVLYWPVHAILQRIFPAPRR